MKKLFLVVLGMFALNAVAISLPEGTPLLSKETSGGFVPPEFAGWAKILNVYDDGQVIESYRQNYESPWQNILLATLSDEVLTKIKTIIETAEPGTIIFPDDPECTDVPSTTYSAKNSGGVIINFAQNAGCRLGFIENFNDAYNLTAVLDGLGLLGLVFPVLH